MPRLRGARGIEYWQKAVLAGGAFANGARVDSHRSAAYAN
jgi:hypothetical protein